MSDFDLGPRPSFVGTDDYQQIWRDQAKAEPRYSRAGLLSESGDDPDELARMPYWRYLRTKHWDLVRRRALAVAEHRCFYCGAKEDLEVHHLTYRRRGCELDEDLMVLCGVCHDISHGHGNGEERPTEEELREVRERAFAARSPAPDA